MKTFTFKFRSIMVNQVEKVIPDTVFSKMVLEMDDSSIEQHSLELTVKDIMRDTAWITNFFLSMMIVFPVSGLLFLMAYFAFGKTADQSALNIMKITFTAAAFVAFILLWIFFSVKVSVENKKRQHVEQKRGKGNWRLVDEAGWDKFYRLLMVAKNQRESEKIIK